MNALKHKPIQVNIDCDIATKEVCKIVAESLLKYVLYQFQQIPVQIDVLEKELAKGEFIPELTEAFKNENELSEDSTDPRSYFRQKGLQKRAELANRMRARKRKVWLMKVEKLVNGYKSMIKILENEINNGAVNTIIYSVGSTPLTPKFIFKLHIPQHLNYKCSHETSTSSVLKRRILLNMLIAFANNADILKFTSSHFSVSKLWTLFEKETSSEVGEYQNTPDIILKPEFSMSTRTRCIEVSFNEQNLVNMAMELTPCVNTHPRKSFNFSLVRNSLTNGNILEEKTNSDFDSDFQSLEYDDSQDEMKVKSVFAKPASLIKTNNLLDEAVKCSAIHTPFRNEEDCSDRRNFILAKTPHHLGNSDCDSMIETPVLSNNLLIPSTPSPVKRLARGITELKFTPTKFENQTNNLNWFQVDFSLSGFKDMC